MSQPRRLQRSRAAGWRMPADAVYVGRPTVWGNPFPLQGSWIVWTAVSLGYRADAAGRRDAAIALYRSWITATPAPPGPLASVDAGVGDVITYRDGSSAAVADVGRAMGRIFAGMYEDKGEGPRPAPRPPALDQIRLVLGGRDLVCWCPPDCPCHADVLLELANQDRTTV